MMYLQEKRCCRLALALPPAMLLLSAILSRYVAPTARPQEEALTAVLKLSTEATSGEVEALLPERVELPSPAEEVALHLFLHRLASRAQATRAAKDPSSERLWRALFQKVLARLPEGRGIEEKHFEKPHNPALLERLVRFHTESSVQ